MGMKCEHGTDTAKYLCDKCEKTTFANLRKLAPKLETLAEAAFAEIGGVAKCRHSGINRMVYESGAPCPSCKAVKPKNELKVPTDAKARKSLPITTGVLDYFPDALLAVAECSKAGNDQHNPGQPLHWAKEKSTDHADCIVRHLLDRGVQDTDGIRHSAKVAWRALALLQIEIEKERERDALST